MTDQEKFKWMKEHIYVPVVCDILDSLGYRHQAMHQRLRPLDEKHCVIVGRARTFRWLDTDYVVEENPYGKEIEAMDSLGEGGCCGTFHRQRRHKCSMGRIDVNGS